MKILGEDELKWPLAVRDDVGDWHSASASRWMFSVYEPQDLTDEAFAYWDNEGYRIHLHEHFRGGCSLRFTRGELEIDELRNALSALCAPGPDLVSFRRQLTNGSL